MPVAERGSAGASLRASLHEQIALMRDGSVPESLTDALVQTVELPGGSAVRIVPRSFGDVREAEALAGLDRPTPYWAMAWASGTALARAVAAEDLTGLRVLELGCGIGMPAVAAARAGATVLATDASPEAVVYAAHNMALNDLEGDVAVADWRDLPVLDEPAWDLVLAADVLYRQENHESLLRLLPDLVAPGGEAWIADPGRAGCRDFLAGARRRWLISSQPDPEKPDVHVHRLRHSSAR
jgi:predicted nicotinamide N-methyase